MIGRHATMVRHVPAPFDEYAADIFGRVWSFKHGRERQLSPATVYGGGFHGTRRCEYLRVGLSAQGERLYVLVHVLVCTLFHGPAPSELHVVRHLDGNSLNCSAENLAWGTVAQNVADRQAHGWTHKHKDPAGFSHAGELF